MLVVSTASPFKFCASVLSALGVKEQKSGTEILSQLTEATGRTAPAPLAGLAGKRVRFDRTVEKEVMPAVVREFLS